MAISKNSLNVNFAALRRRIPWSSAYRAASRRLKAGYAIRVQNAAQRRREKFLRETAMPEVFRSMGAFDVEFLEQIERKISKCHTVQGIDNWTRRLAQLSAALAQGNGTNRQLEDHLFELKVIARLVRTQHAKNIIYEPRPLNTDGPNCDLAFEVDGEAYLLELKCIHPEWIDQDVRREHIAPNNLVVMDGPAYHIYEAGRDKLIQHSSAAEGKFANYSPGQRTVLVLLTGFHMDLEEVRDFVFIYRFSQARPDDPLGVMTLHELKKREPFRGSIREFWALPFLQEGFTLAGPAISVAPLKTEDQRLDILTRRRKFGTGAR